MKKQFILPLLFSFLLGALLTSCAVSEPLKVFVRGDGSNMYFVKPQRFNGKTGCRYVTVEWTIHTKHDSVERVVMNYSVYADQPLRRVDSLRFQSPTLNGAWIAGGKCFFIEPSGRGFQSRWSADFPNGDLQKLFSSPNVRIELQGGAHIVTEGSGATKKTFKALRTELLPLLQ